METNKKGCYSAGIYARLSVDHGIKNESIASQIAIAKSYLAQQKEIDLYDCYIDLGESGTHFKRAGFLKLMDAIRAGKVNCVIVKDFSRFGRNYIEVGNYIDKIFPFLGVRFISVADGFDSDKKEEQELDRNLKNLVNEMYANDAAQKVKEVKKLYREQGNYIGSSAPYGYQIEKIGGKRTLVADEMAFEIVKQIIQFYLEGKSQGEIAVWLYQNRIHRPSDYRRTGHIYCIEGETLLEWQKGSIRQILNHPLYLQKREEILSQEQSALENVRNNKIERRFDKEANLKKGVKIDLDQNVWKGMFYCGDCNHILSYRSDRKKKIYFCGRANRMDILQCRKKQITEEAISSCVVILLQYIFQHTFQKKENFISLGSENREELTEYGLKKAKECKKKQMMQIKRIDMQIAVQKRMISDSYKDYQVGKIEKEEFLAKKRAEKGKVESLEKQKWKKTQQIQRIEQVSGEVEDWIGMIAEGKQNCLKETSFLPYAIDVIEKMALFCGKRILVRFRIRNCMEIT